MSQEQLLLTFLEEEGKKPDDAESEDQGPAANQDPTPPQAKRRKPTQKLLRSLENLPTVERTIVDPEVLANPDDYRLIGQETSVRLHAKPHSFTREIVIRQTHVRKNDPDAVPITPPLEPCLLPGSVLTPSLGALLLTEKFCYHQPFHRLEWRLRASHGIELTRNNMCNWHDHLAELLLRLYQRIAGNLRSSSYIKVDETPIDYLDPGSGKTATGYFWVYHHAEHGPLFDWQPSRANTCLDNILIDPEGENSFSGYLQSDGLRAYRTFIERFPLLAIIAVSCLAHIRRKFWEARNDHPRIASWILYQMGKIYELDERLRKRRAGPALRQRARRLLLSRTYRHLEKLFTHLQNRKSILPKSALGKALAYACDQWPHLLPCFEDGQIEFDNNLTENAIRPTKLGLKNWMFIGGEETGWRSAVIYTFVEQVRRHGLDPYAYFEWVFEKLMSQPGDDELDDLLPVNWVTMQRRSKVSEDTTAVA